MTFSRKLRFRRRVSPLFSKKFLAWNERSASLKLLFRQYETIFRQKLGFRMLPMRKYPVYESYGYLRVFLAQKM